MFYSSNFEELNYQSVGANFSGSTSNSGTYKLTADVTFTATATIGYYWFSIPWVIDKNVKGNAQLRGGTLNPAQTPDIPGKTKRVKLTLAAPATKNIYVQGLTSNTTNNVTFEPDEQAGEVFFHVAGDGTIRVVAYSGKATRA